MYHIKDDLRAKKSAELLYEGLEQCMKKKEFDKITVTDITKESTVSRATFYRNFDLVIDILYWKCNQLFQKVLSDYVASKPDLNQPYSLISFVFHFWMEHTEILELLIHQRRTDIISNAFIGNADIVMEYIRERIQIPKYNDKYFLATRVGIFTAVFQTWIDCGKKETLSELIQILSMQYYVIDNSKIIY